MLSVISTPLGNLRDITLNALDVLSKANVFLCEDTRITKSLLNHLNNQGLLKIDLNDKKFFPLHSHNENEFLQSITPAFFDDEVVYCCDAGMPCISDPGSALISYAIANDIKFEIFGGVSALTLAYAYSGTTNSNNFIFTSFLPSKSQARLLELSKYVNMAFENNLSLIIYESPARIVDLLADISAICPDCRVLAIKELTKLYQKSFLGAPLVVLENLKTANTNGEWVVVISQIKIKKNIAQKQLSFADIVALDLPIKALSKIISKSFGINAKEVYSALNEVDCADITTIIDEIHKLKSRG